MLDILQFQAQGHDNFLYLLLDKQNGKAWAIDPAWDVALIRQTIKAHGACLSGIFITHYHHDHVNATLALREETTPVFIHEQDALYWQDCPKNAIVVADGDRIPLSDNEVMEVIHTAGHTQGSVCYRYKNALFTGDTLFVYGCGRADFEHSDVHALYQSLGRLRQLDDEILIYSGHDYGMEKISTLGEQKQHNPFLLIDNEEDFSRYRLTISRHTRRIPFTPMSKEEVKAVIERYR